ncbi:MAG: hypothetical protein SH847_19175, partial [Roseiflexaceae bacterium]|nr:hypothetical protein [Roseiflexaceae bacterium]
MMLRRRMQAIAPDIGALLLLIILPMLVFWRIWASNPDDRIMFGGDILMGAFPTRVFVHQLTSLGQLPLWNPYQLGGMPLAGDIQVAPFYLPNLILDWLSRGKDISYLGFELLVVAHYMLGAIGMYAYLRRLNIQVAAALVGSIAFEFNGFFIGHRGHYNMLAAAAWLPAVLCLFDYAWAARGLVRTSLWIVLAGLALSQMVMAGHPQATLYCGTLLGAYGLWRWANDLRQHAKRPSAASADRDKQEQQQPFHARVRAFLPGILPTLRVPIVLVCAGLIGLGLSAVALLPAFELLGRSLRSTPTYEFSAQYSLLPRNLIGLFIPELLNWSGTEFRIYAGVITLVLAATALIVP